MSTAAVILAAGIGHRFVGSTHKLLAPFRGRPLVTWAVEHALDADLDAVAVVTGATGLDGILPPQVVQIHNHEWQEGQATSVQAAVAWAREVGHDAVVIGLGDQPLVPGSAWAAVASADSPIAIASFGGARRPPVRLDRSVWPLLPTAGDAGARILMARRPELVREVSCSGEPADVDTVEELAQWT